MKEGKLKSEVTISPQQRGARTRARNRMYQKLYETTTKPAHEKVEKVLNHLLIGANVRLRIAAGFPFRLKHGVVGARLMAVDHGGLGFTVHIDGYKDVKHYSSAFWELE